MKKKISVTKIAALGLTGAIILTGCGATKEAPTVEEYIRESAGDYEQGSNTGASESGAVEEGNAADNKNVEKNKDGAAGSAGSTDNGGDGVTESAAAESPAAEAESGAADEAAQFSQQKNAAADMTDNIYDDYARSGGAIKEMSEWKTENVYDDLYAEAPGGYLGSCYDYDDDNIVPENNEEYSKWEEKGFSNVMREPVSTFAADVDTASYSNLRRMIRDGWDLENLPEGSVRIEELLNYFSYDFEEPVGQEPFGVTTQLGPCPWNDEAELLMIGLKTESVNYDYAPSSNLVFLLDVSGSMGDPDKLPLLQESFATLTDNLTNKDRISIVTYAEEDKVVLQGAHGDEKKKIKKALNSLEAGGGTYGSKGIERAYELAEEYFIKGGNNRIILATDGDLNIGMTTEEELEELISEKKESGIFLSVLGFGTGNIKDNKMETLADKGNGNYAYIDCLREADKVLLEEMTATLVTICKDVKFQVEFNPDIVEGYRLLGYENRALDRQDFDDDEKDGGEIGAGHSVTALYEIVLRDSLKHNLTEDEISGLRYGNEYQKRLDETKKAPASEGKYKEWLTISIRYKKPAGNVSLLLEYPVGYDSYREYPSADFRFAAAVAEFGLLASHSRYPEDASLAHVRKTLKELDFKDVYKIEFLELVEQVEE